MTEGLKNLIRSFIDDDGLPEEPYDAACELIGEQLGDAAVSIFARRIEATDGRFYLPDDEAANEIVAKLEGRRK